MSDLRFPAPEFLRNPKLRLWEDISESYWVLRTGALTAGGLLIFYDNFATPEEIDYIKRYLAVFPARDIVFSPVIYDKIGEFYCQDDCAELSRLIREKKYAVLKYRAVKKYYTDQEVGKKISLFNKIAVPLTLPNYRARCQEIYLYYKQNKDKLDYIYNILEDDVSRAVLTEIIRAASENDYYRLPESPGFVKYFECYEHKNDEIWVNCGSCYGDTIAAFLAHGYKFKRILAVEGDNRYYDKLVNFIAELPEPIRKRINPFNFYIGEENSENSLDSLYKNTSVSLINMDIEGYETPTLRGGRETIAKNRPVLAICAYHKSADLYEIPRFVTETASDYAFFLRKYISFEGNAFNEYLYYCVPRERLLRDNA